MPYISGQLKCKLTQKSSCLGWGQNDVQNLSACEERTYKNKQQIGINQPANDFGFNI